MPPEAIDLASRLLQYSPSLRCTAVSFLAFFFFACYFDSFSATFIDWFQCAFLLEFLKFKLQLEACAHPFFDELREPNARLPNGRPFPPLFNFNQEVSFLYTL